MLGLHLGGGNSEMASKKSRSKSARKSSSRKSIPKPSPKNEPALPRSRISHKGARLALWQDRLEKVRKVSAGYSARDGYDLSRMGDWSEKQKRRLRTAFRYVRKFSLETHKVVRGRTDRQRKALGDFTGQRRRPGKVDAFFVPTALPDKTRVNIRRDGSVRIVRGNVEQEFHMFRRVPRSLDAMRAAIKQLARTLPPGKYFPITSVNELVGEGIQRELLAEWFEELINQYGQRFALFLRGFRWIGTDSQAVFREQERMREAQDAHRRAVDENKARRKELARRYSKK